MGIDRNNFEDDTHAADEPRWAVCIMRIETEPAFGAACIHAPDRFRYVAVTLEVVYRGSGAGELYPQTVTLVHTGVTPLQGLARPPAFFLGWHADRVVQPVDASVVIAAPAGVPQRITLAYEFHRDCCEFCLYFPGCEGMHITLAG